MSLILYERLCADDRRPSPFCWRTRLALAHKGLTPETRAVKFTEADQVAFSGQGRVPVIVDGETVVADSWHIACYLEQTYPGAPSLFGGEAGRELARFVQAWVEGSLQKTLSAVLAPSVFACAHGDDKDYYRTTREEKWGMTIEALSGLREAHVATLHKVMEPLRLRLAEAPYLSGEAPAYADYLVFAEFQFARCVDAEDLVPAEDTAIRAWRSRLLDRFDGLARSVPAFDSAA